MDKSFYKKWSFLFKFRLFLGAILLIIVFIFLYLKIVPFGRITYSRNFESWFRSGKGFIYSFSPAERVDLKNGLLPRMIGDPLYFSVFTPRTFDTVKLTIKYRDHLSAKEPIIESGILVDGVVRNYDLKPLQNDIIDNLKKNWPRLENASNLLLQIGREYASWANFEKDLKKGQLKNCPEGINSCLVAYNYNLAPSYQVLDNQVSMPIMIDTPLRGAHQLYIYLNNQPLHLELAFFNLRQDKAGDPITVNVYSINDNNKLIFSKYLPDDQLAITNQIIIDDKQVKNGVYKIEIKVRDDTVIKSISSSVDKLVFINKIWPVSARMPLSLWTDASYLQTKVYSPASRQTISFAGHEYNLNKAYEQVDLLADNPDGAKEIVLAKDDIILENNGVFAFNKESLFNPSVKKIDRFFILNNNIKYILADYETPLEYKEKGFKTKSVIFNTKGVYREKNKYNFMISVPGLKIETGAEDYVEIKEIRLEFQGRTLWQKLFSKN